MGSDFKSIPIIDISPLLSKCNDPDMTQDREFCEVVKQIDQACKEAGFFYVKGHGIPDSLVKEVRDLTRQFFHLSYEEKLKIKMTPKTGYRGYQRIGENVTKGTPDIHEAIDCYREIKPGMYGSLGEPLEGSNQWPDNPSNFNSCMEEYIKLLTDLSRNIMRGIALALGGSYDEFEDFSFLRLRSYLSDASFHVFCLNKSSGAHTDYGLLTLVNQDDEIPALQVRNQSGEWIWAVPIPGTFVCNIGDMLKIWSNGLYESTVHRVINNSQKYRVSVAYFYEPNFDAAVKPLDFCKQKTGGIDKFERAVYGEHLVSKVTTNFAM